MVGEVAAARVCAQTWGQGERGAAVIKARRYDSPGLKSGWHGAQASIS